MPDIVYDSKIKKRFAYSGIGSASATCFTFPCLMASGKLAAALWVNVEGNVEPPSEAEKEEDGIGPPANAGGGFGLVRVSIACL